MSFLLKTARGDKTTTTTTANHTTTAEKMPSTSRPFSTVSPVHPNYLPKLHKSGRMEKKLAAATIAALGVGYGVSALMNNQLHYSADDTASSSSSSSSSASYHSATGASSSSHREQQKRREMAMLDAYGDRGSLEELEAAVNAYASQQAERERKSRK
ncbi:uncharacterized protein B0I36DRAFT_357023 [Microdochium trichocladiopsis]|uniref:Uncharacterized protein n=1 Tax=Microdochium trichocladiopsis TaxID=1682393 RepID=A0A9P8YD47_9PEZI|nr:uncharacterized protein B0I36DRAFT_357023 [Microdochium trichocladiopsis]KAH7039617.1 hypothetical protein B0I36DRAFT_357023 [Microdochium trichocladiopsis]